MELHASHSVNSNPSRNSDMELQCPVKKGEYTITQTAQLPKEIPPGESGLPFPRVKIYLCMFHRKIQGHHPRVHSR